MENFWDYNVWGTLSLFAVLFGSLLTGNVLRKAIPLLRNSLIPTSVIGGVVLIGVSALYRFITGNVMFDTAFFGGNGTHKLEVITYHALALGFIASTLKDTSAKMNKERTREILNTGVTTVATYLLQGILGFAITMIAARIVSGFFPAAGVLLPFGYGQGTGQALNYGNIYEVEYGFIGGKSFGLSIAAMGFISASVGGVIHLNIRKHRGRLQLADRQVAKPMQELPRTETEKPFSESMDKMTVQISLIAMLYFLTYALMCLLGNLLPGMKSVIYGFNFLLGVVLAMAAKGIKKFLRYKNIIRKRYTDDFLLTRTSNLCFDVMIVAGIAAIRLDTLMEYWGILLILGVVGAVATYIYLRFICARLFPRYAEEQLMMMYGMLTGTASTGVILLREIDGEFTTPASDNMIYQNLPAIVLGFPMMILATMAPEKPVLTMAVLAVYFIAMNLILFRSLIFKKR